MGDAADVGLIVRSLGLGPVDVVGHSMVGFVGGFVYLVATMPRNRGDWPGDDGAVV